MTSEARRRRLRRGGRERGVVLIEALITASVLAVGAIAIARGQLRLRHDGDLAAQRSEAVRLAQDELESLRAAPTDGLVDAHRRLSPPTGAGGASAGWRLDRSVAPAGVGTLRDATVDVAWTDADGSPRHVVLRTLLGGHDPAWAGAFVLRGR